MLCTKTLSQPLQLAYTLNFQIVEIIIKSYIPIFINRINIVELTVAVREKHQLEYFETVSKNVH